jgi:hypothetical protein
VRLDHQLAEPYEVVAFECIDGGRHAPDLADDVAGAAEGDVVGRDGEAVDLGSGDVAEGCEVGPAEDVPEAGDGLFAFAAAVVVGGGGELPRNGGVGDDDGEAVFGEAERDVPVVERAAVDEQGVVALRERRGELAFSARWQRSARLTGSVGLSSRCTSSNVNIVAVSRAADDDRPAPCGTSPWIAMM